MREAYERDGTSGSFSTTPWLTSLTHIGASGSGPAPDIAHPGAPPRSAYTRTGASSGPHQGPAPGPRRRLNAPARPAALAAVREAYKRGGASGACGTDPRLTGTTRPGLAPGIVRPGGSAPQAPPGLRPGPGAAPPEARRGARAAGWVSGG
ncbi:hypothetical protein [Streptomyces sp. NPDC059850]|uniref:hypothetical protein n=1 Tax=Streptomyces sp. NPDC059850 TaxID=3346970 RepID=UPI003648A712